MTCAVVTVAIGANHRSAYSVIFRPSVERYVARHGYDLVVFEESLADPGDPFGAVVNFEAMRVPFQERLRFYDRIMVLDVDVLASAAAPPFHELDLGGRIGVVDEWCQPSLEERHRFQAINGLVVSARGYHARGGFALASDSVVNGGLYICSPALHGPLFRDLVARYVPSQPGHPFGAQFQQAMLSFELQANGLAHFLPAQWNCLWPHHRRTMKWGAPVVSAQERWADLRRFREVLDTNFFVHMTGGLDHDLAFVSRNYGRADRSAAP